MITGDMVLAERKRRRMSRSAFAGLTGLAPSKINAIEHGRVIKPEELELLVPHVPETTGEVPVPVATAPSDAIGDGASPVFLLTEDELEEDDDFLFPFSPTGSESASVPDSKRRVSNSEIQAFKRCRRKWWLGWVRGLRLKAEPVTGARSIGDRVHRALAPWYVADGQVRVDPRETLEKVLVEDWTATVEAAHALGREPDIDVTDQFKREADLARAMVSGYVDWITETGADADYEVIAAETKLEAELPGMRIPVSIIGKLDVRLRRRADDVNLFMDHKTTGSLSEPLRTIHLDEQMLMYHVLEHMTLQGKPTDGALYNMLKKVKRTGTAKPPFYERVEVRHNPHEIESFLIRLVGVVDEMLRVEELLRSGVEPRTIAYPTPNRNCSWDCDFLAICPMFDDGSRVDDFIADMYVERDPLAYYEVKVDER